MTAALVWADMHSLPRRLGSRPRALGLVLAVLGLAALAACSSPARRRPVTVAELSRPPARPRARTPDTSVGIDLPAPSDDPALIDPGGRIVVPKPGQLDVRPIPAQTLLGAPWTDGSVT